jgi:hypothetical protein
MTGALRLLSIRLRRMFRPRLRVVASKSGQVPPLRNPPAPLSDVRYDPRQFRRFD